MSKTKTHIETRIRYTAHTNKHNHTFSLRFDTRTTTPGIMTPLAIGCGVAGLLRAIASRTARKFAIASIYICKEYLIIIKKFPLPGFCSRAGDMPVNE